MEKLEAQADDLPTCNHYEVQDSVVPFPTLIYPLFTHIHSDVLMAFKDCTHSALQLPCIFELSPSHWWTEV